MTLTSCTASCGGAELGASVPGGVGRTVEQGLAGLVDRAADGEGVVGIEGVDQGQGAVVRAGNHSYGELRQHDGRASVERNVFHFFGGDGLTYRGILRIDDGRAGCDLDRLGGTAHFEFEIDDRMLARADVEAFANRAIKARRFDNDVVIARQKEQGTVLARGIGDGIVFGLGVGLGYRYPSSGDNASGSVGDCAADGSPKFLGERCGG